MPSANTSSSAWGWERSSTEPARTIIGVVGDTHNVRIGRPPEPMMMVPTAQVVDWYAGAYADISALLWVMRTRGDPHELMAAATEQLRLASDGFPVAHIRTMDEVMGRSTARESFNMMLLTIFGAVALVLAAIGIYGLMAYSVQQRTQEMGIRMALGADRSAVRKLVVWQGMRLALVGVAMGMAAAFGLTRLIASFLFGVRSWDPAAFLLAPIILVGVALARCVVAGYARLQGRPDAGAARGVTMGAASGVPLVEGRALDTKHECDRTG